MRLCFCLAIVLALVAIISQGGVAAYLADRGRVQALVEQAGLLGPVVILLLFVVIEILVFPGPVETLIVVVSYAYPLVSALVLSVCGGTLASTSTFLTIRLLKRYGVLWACNGSNERPKGKLTTKMFEEISVRPIFATFIIRAIPGGRAPVVTAAFALTGIDTFSCFVGTGLAAIPTLGTLSVMTSLSFFQTP